MVYAMHHFVFFILFWAYLGGLIPAAMISAALFGSGRHSLLTQITFGILGGPSVWTVLGGAGLIGLFLGIRHRMSKGRPLVPPPGPPPAAHG